MVAVIVLLVLLQAITDKMATVVLVVLVVLQAIAVNHAEECAPECKTCYSFMTSVCMSCYEGTFLRRHGQYYKCEKCDDGCISCEYYGDCDKCFPGKYGDGCQFNCSEGCVNNTCEQLSGSCACKEDFTGAACAECISGRYGLNCTLQCNFGCLNNSCNKETGECSCKDGFTGLNCSQCLPGLFGQSCQSKCSNGCQEGTCDRETGHCNCKTYYSGEKCNECVKGKYGTESNCSLLCPTTCISCKTDGICFRCKPGYYGLYCQLSCPSGCLLGYCGKVYGYCLKLACKQGYTGARCDYCKATGKYGNDCNLDCVKNCLRCSSNVSCDECMKGYWGSDCTNPCPNVCNGQPCSQYDGACSKLAPCENMNLTSDGTTNIVDVLTVYQYFLLVSALMYNM